MKHTTVHCDELRRGRATQFGDFYRQNAVLRHSKRSSRDAAPVKAASGHEITAVANGDMVTSALPRGVIHTDCRAAGVGCGGTLAATSVQISTLLQEGQ